MATSFEKLRRPVTEILEHCAPKLSKDEVKKKTDACMAELQRQTEEAQIDRTCLINDPIYGPVELTPLMYKIINTSEFHRLKDIKQLGAAHYVYPGANHTRFDHSIGVCHLAREFGNHLRQQLLEDSQSTIVSADPDRKKLWVFEKEELLCAQLAGLCHDLGHGPYSNDMFEDLGLKKDDLSVSIFKRMLVENPKVLVELVKAGFGKSHVELIEWMIQPDKLPADSDLRKRAFLFEIVYNRTTGIDVDKWDCYARDCHYLGVTSDFQWKRCMHLGRIIMNDKDELHIAFRDKQLDDIYGMYRTGVILHQKAYHHKTIKAVEEMTADAFREIFSSLEFIQGREGSPKSIKEAFDEANNDNLEWYLALTDSIIGMIKCTDVNSLGNGNKSALERAKELLKRIERRDLYHMAAKTRIPKMHSMLRTDDHLREKNAVWKAAWDDLRLHQPRNDAIYRYLDETMRRVFGNNGIWVSIIDFRLPPDHIQQEVVNGQNPAEKVLFYRKQEVDKETVLLSPEDIRSSSSLLVVPQAFVECEVRVYDTRPADKRKKEHETALKHALQEWQRNTEEMAQQEEQRHQQEGNHQA